MNMSARPELNQALSAHDFLDFYWLKSELVAFCRANHLPVSGSKSELTKRIAHFLDTGERLAPTPAKKKVKADPMPTTFTRATVIGEGWRCTQVLRAFFEQEVTIKFHFNGFMRDFITNSGVGHTLDEAIEGWLESKRQPKGSSEIGRQFEYNRHIRAFFEANPNASREDAISAWKAKRATRASERT